MPIDDQLTTTQAADILGVSRMTVTRFIDRGELKADKPSGNHRHVLVGPGRVRSSPRATSPPVAYSVA